MSIRTGKYSDDELLILETNLDEIQIGDITVYELSKILNRKENSIRTKLYQLGVGSIPATQYAVYKGEKILAEGTLHEISKKLGVKIDTVRFYGMASYHKRSKGNNKRTLVRL